MAIADFSLYIDKFKIPSNSTYIFFLKFTPELIDSAMSRYLNFSTQVVNFTPGQVQTNAVWIVHPGKKGQLYRSRVKIEWWDKAFT